MEGFVYDDGGRAAAGFKGSTGDCVVRAIAIAADLPYREVYDELFDRQRAVVARQRRAARSDASPRTGVLRKAYEPYLFDLGWMWTPTMRIGEGTTVHLSADELPSGRIVVAVSRHVCAILGGVIHDIHDPRRYTLDPSNVDATVRPTRAVYGYYEVSPR